MKKTIWLAGLLALAVYPLAGQNETSDSSELESFEEVLISSQRMGETRMNTTRQIEVITARSIEQAQQPTMAEVLSQTGQVFVQKSQLGGGSPVLRGFEASRVLLVVDGVRMNNATYRAGHLQDIVTMDPFILDRMEIYFSSGSTLYGSDALGGVIYMKTKSPVFTDTIRVHPSALLRYSTAGQNVTANVGWNASNKNISWLFNYSFNRYGDLRMGQGRNFSDIDTFGLRTNYIRRINGIDSVVQNDRPHVQVGSGYDQSDFFSKISVKHGKWISSLNLQGSYTTLVPRYDRLTQMRNGQLRFAQWAYTPQNRQFASYTAEKKSSERSTHRFIASVQSTEVGRLSRPFQAAFSNTQLDYVKMWALNYDHRYQINKSLVLQSGAEYVFNDVESNAFIDDVKTGFRAPSNETRYADSLARTHSASVFSNLSWVVKPDNFSINAGMRIGFYRANALFTPNNFWNIDFGKVQVQNLAPVFNLGAVKKIRKGLFVTTNLSSGFRNPNIDDLTKLFESIPGEKYITPNPGLQPEKTVTADLGLRFMKFGRFSMETGVYYTRISDLLIDQQAQLNGADSVLYNGQMTPVFRMDNSASGEIQGAYIGAKVRITQHIYGDVYYATTMGTYRPSDGAETQPLDHIAPDHGRVAVKYVRKDFRAEAFMLFNGWKLASTYSPSGEDNVSQAPGGETPSWETYNIRCSYVLNSKLSFTLAVENIMDLNYRVFASGINAPGRNLIASVRVTL